MPRQPQHLGKQRLVERRAFGGRLDLDDSAHPGQHEIGVGHRLRIFGIVEIEHGDMGNDAAGDRGDIVAQWQSLQQTGRKQPLKRQMEGHIAAGDRGGTGASVRLQHIAVDLDLTLAQLGEIGHRPQAAADQPLDFLRASALPAASRLAVGARRRRARQHPVFRRDPSFAGIAQKGRHPLLNGGGAQHMGVAELREARAFGIFGDTGLEADGPHRIAGAS